MKIKKRMLSLALVFVLLTAPSNTAFAGIRSTTIPTACWTLNAAYNQTEQTDWVNHRGQYPYSAYLNGYVLYSNYYFEVETANRFRFYGAEIYPVSDVYNVGLVNYNNIAIRSYTPINASTHSFDIWAPSTGVYFGYEAFFYINCSGGAEVSLNGFVDTW